jgi:hypothetical protein
MKRRTRRVLSHAALFVAIVVVGILVLSAILRRERIIRPPTSSEAGARAKIPPVAPLERPQR